jgi:hypothetical protein
MTVAMVYQSDTYICASLRLMMVAKTLTANITQRMTTPMSSGHSSSAYSFDWVMPAKSESAASVMATLKIQSWALASRGKTSGRPESRITT